MARTFNPSYDHASQFAGWYGDPGPIPYDYEDVVDARSLMSYGIQTDQVYVAMQHGAVEYVLASGTLGLRFTDGSFAPVVCGEVIPISTEDGPATGRCGGRCVGVEAYACEVHASERDAWRAMSELSLIHI